MIEYLANPPGREQLARLIADAGLQPRDAVRRKEALYAELGLDRPEVTDAALLDAMAAHPILIERPLVVTDRGVKLCRPSEAVLDLLPPLPTPFTKEDGQQVG